MKTFEFEQDLNGNRQKTKFNVINSNFGDGYEQNTSIGINNRKHEFSYQRTANKALILQIKAFFDEHSGAKAFSWQSPLDGKIKVKASDYELNCLGGDIWQISTTFTQVFYP